MRHDLWQRSTASFQKGITALNRQGTHKLVEKRIVDDSDDWNAFDCQANRGSYEGKAMNLFP